MLQDRNIVLGVFGMGMDQMVLTSKSSGWEQITVSIHQRKEWWKVYNLPTQFSLVWWSADKYISMSATL